MTPVVSPKSNTRDQLALSPNVAQNSKVTPVHPLLTIKPDANQVQYHWYNPQNTIYVALPADGGLCWDLLDWAENL